MTAGLLGATLRPDPAIWRGLSKREREVFIGLAEGLSDKEIGARLGISSCTVKVHVKNIRRLADGGSQLDTRVGLLRRVCPYAPPRLVGNAEEVVSRETEKAA